MTRAVAAVLSMVFAGLAGMACGAVQAQSRGSSPAAAIQVVGASGSKPVQLDYSPPSCAYVKSHGNPLSESEKMDAEFDKNYPRVLRDDARIDHVYLGRTQLENIVMYLACMASLPEATSFVPDEAVTLFASKRYGRESFRILKRESMRKQKDSQDARRFYKQMQHFIKPPAE